MIDFIDDTVADAIPHRPPFLFVDRVLSLEENRILAERTISIDEFYFEGHYPSAPIMPGVLLCEAVFQAAGIFMSKKLAKEGACVENKVPILAKITEAKFKKMALPGDKVVLEAIFLERMRDFYFFDGRVIKDDSTIASLSFTLGLADKSLLKSTS